MSVISYQRGNSNYLTENFKYREFDCKCGCGTTKHDTDLSLKLQILRSYYGKAVIVTSGYRCPTHNARCSKSKDSYHTKGMAADIIINDENVWEIAKVCEAIGFTGIGVYDDGYVHVDCRPTKYFWHNDGSNSVSTFGGSGLTIELPSEKPVATNAAQMSEDIKAVLKKYGYM